MMDTCKLVKGKVILSTMTVGPRYDPYSRTIIEMIGHDGRKKWKLILCALAGVSFQQFEGYEAQASEHDVGMKAIHQLVESTTGMPIKFWTTKLWDYQHRAMLARYGREQYNAIMACIEADEALMRYAR